MTISTGKRVRDSAIAILDELAKLRDVNDEHFLAFDLTERENEFVEDLLERRRSADFSLTVKQLDWLADIHRRVRVQIADADRAAATRTTGHGLQATGQAPAAPASVADLREQVSRTEHRAAAEAAASAKASDKGVTHKNLGPLSVAAVELKILPQRKQR